MGKLLSVSLILISLLALISCTGGKNTETAGSDISKQAGIDVDDDIFNAIDTFLLNSFRDQKIILFDSFDNISEEFNRVVLFVALFYGTIYEYPGENLTLDMIKENIEAVYGAEILSKLDYTAMRADYDPVKDEYERWDYIAPGNSFSFVYHSIKNISGNKYEAVISYIDGSTGVTTFDAKGNRFSQDEVNEILYEPYDVDYFSNDYRNIIYIKLKNEILSNPDKYETVKITLELTDDHIRLLKAENNNNISG